MQLRRLGIKTLAWVVVMCVFAALPHKAAAAKVHPLRVQNGILTVDGLTVRTAINLQVPNFHYLYVYVPGSGTGHELKQREAQPLEKATVEQLVKDAFTSATERHIEVGDNLQIMCVTADGIEETYYPLKKD